MLRVHPLVELILGWGVAQDRDSACGRIEALKAGRVAGRGEGLAGSRGVQDPLDGGSVGDLGDDPHRLPTAGAPQREDFINAGELHRPQMLEGERDVSVTSRVGAWAGWLDACAGPSFGRPARAVTAACSGALGATVIPMPVAPWGWVRQPL